MISTFKCENFLSVKEKQCLSFEASPDQKWEEYYCIPVRDNVNLLKIGIIYGNNASGKSNIISALDFLKELMLNIPKDKTEKIPVTPFLLDEKSKKEPTLFELVFYINKEKYNLEIQFDQDRIYKETVKYFPGQLPAMLYERTYNEQLDVSEIKFGAKCELAKKEQKNIEGNTINNCSVIAAFGITNVKLSKLNLLYDYFISIAPMLSLKDDLTKYTLNSVKADPQLKLFALKFLKASDFNISGFDIQKKEMTITPEMRKLIPNLPLSEKEKNEILSSGKISNDIFHFKHHTEQGDFSLPENLESVGTLRYLGLTTLLYNLLRRNCILLVDEIESSIHYELLSYFLKVFLVNGKKNSQLIMTTHDLNLLDEDFIRRDTVWFTEKDDTAATRLVRLSSLGLHKSLSPYNAYRQNKLTNLPFTDSIFLEDFQTDEGGVQ